MSKKKKELQINYLDLIPERSTQLRWHTDIRGRMVLEIENKGAFNTIAQKPREPQSPGACHETAKAPGRV